MNPDGTEPDSPKILEVWKLDQGAFHIDSRTGYIPDSLRLGTGARPYCRSLGDGCHRTW